MLSCVLCSTRWSHQARNLHSSRLMRLDNLKMKLLSAALNEVHIRHPARNPYFSRWMAAINLLLNSRLMISLFNCNWFRICETLSGALTKSEFWVRKKSDSFLDKVWMAKFGESPKIGKVWKKSEKLFFSMENPWVSYLFPCLSRVQIAFCWKYTDFPSIFTEKGMWMKL